MKTAVVIFLVVFLAVSLESSKASHNKQRKSKNVRYEESLDGGMGGVSSQEPGDWPNPGSVANFVVPGAFTENIGADDAQPETTGDEPPSGKHHRKSSHRGHKN